VLHALFFGTFQRFGFGKVLAFKPRESTAVPHLLITPLKCKTITRSPTIRRFQLYRNVEMVIPDSEPALGSVLAGMVNQHDTVAARAEFNKEIVDDQPSVRIIGVKLETPGERVDEDDLGIEPADQGQKSPLIDGATQAREIFHQFRRQQFQIFM